MSLFEDCVEHVAKYLHRHRDDLAKDFTAFYNATWGRTVACAYAIAGDLGAAEDLAQDAYTRAWPRWSTIRGHWSCSPRTSRTRPRWFR